MIGMVMAAMLLQVAAPSAEAEALGRRLADTGTLSVLAPLVSEQETEGLIAGVEDLTDREKAQLRATAKEIAARNTDRLLAAEGHAYAARLSLEDLRTLVAAAEGASAKRLRAALPGVVAETMKTAGGVNFRGDVLNAFCEKTGKGCPTIP